MNHKTPEAKYLDAHKKMWTYIADSLKYGSMHIGNELDAVHAKQEYLTSHNLSPVYAGCFACDYGIEITHKIEGRCENCLLDWPSDQERYQCIDDKYMDDCGGLYCRFCSEPVIDKQVELAIEIANLPLSSKITEYHEEEDDETIF